jgi:hypothetical protein
MGEGAGGASRKKRKKTELTTRKPRKGAEPGLNITPEENRRYVKKTML